jgi:MFS family permease
MDFARIRTRFLVLTALRWLPVGLLIPVLVLLPLQRGLSLSQVGLAFAAQGLVVFALELPTGGLADAVGRRPVLLAAAGIGFVSVGLMLFADTLAGFAVAYALQGVYRALDSGPLDAWYVDSSIQSSPDASYEKGLSSAGVVLGVALAIGAVAGGGLVTLGDLGPIPALGLPIAASLVVRVVSIIAISTLVTEQPRDDDRTYLVHARETPATVRRGIRLLRHSPVLLSLVAVSVFWGFGSTAYEGLPSVRLAELIGSSQRAASIMGPAASVAWLSSAAGAALTPHLARRFGLARSAGLLRILHGASVALMGVFTGVGGMLAAYLGGYLFHGASNPAHMTLLHRQASGEVRATVMSLDSMAAQPAAALGAVTLTALADVTSVRTALFVAAAVLAAAAPLYIPARQQGAAPLTDESVSPAGPGVGPGWAED